MQPTNGGSRRSLAVALAVAGAGGATMAALLVPSAAAAPDPCAASEVARTAGNVAITVGNYLDAHPQTNQALTTISQQQAGPQSLGSLEAYFGANPQAAKDIQRLQQPLVSLGARCKLPVSLPQLMGLAQATQQQGGAATAGLPVSTPSAQNVAVPGNALPSQPDTGSTAVSGPGPLPGPATTAQR